GADVSLSVPMAATAQTARAKDSQSDRDAERPHETSERRTPATLRGSLSQVTARRFQFVRDDEVEALASPESLAAPLAVGTLATLTAKPGTGKTFVALDLALSVASGREWLDKFDVRRGMVVYVVAEGGGGVGMRLRAWKQARAVEGTAG